MHALLRTWIALALLTPASPEVKWVANLGGRIYSSVVVADLNRDGLVEILDCDSEDRQLVCLDSGGKELWRYGGTQVFSIRLTSTPAVGDLDRDGEAEIYLAGGDGQLVRLDEGGAEVWRLQPPGNVDWCCPALLTRPEPLVLIGTNDRWLVAVGPEGEIAWQRQLRGGMGGRMAIVDVDGDGSEEIVCSGGGGGNYCFDYGGELRWRHPSMTATDSGPAAGCLREGEPVTLVCVEGEGTLAALDAATARVRWRYRTVAHNNPIDATLALADLNGDGALEILFCDITGYVYALTAGGAEYWVSKMENGAYAAPAVGDVDGDGRPEVLVGSNDGYLYCFDAEGNLKWRFAALPLIGTSPAIADIDGDGETEILVGSHNNRVHCLTLHGRYDPFLVPWPCWRANSANTGWVR